MTTTNYNHEFNNHKSSPCNIKQFLHDEEPNPKEHPYHNRRVLCTLPSTLTPFQTNIYPLKNAVVSRQQTGNFSCPDPYMVGGEKKEHWFLTTNISISYIQLSAIYCTEF